MSDARRVAIVGSRTWSDAQRIREFVASLPKDSVVVSGGAQGVDTFAEEAAKDCGLAVEVFKPDWERHGRSAGFLRNLTIVENASEVVAFWDGESRGTANTIKTASRLGVPVRVIREDDL